MKWFEDNENIIRLIDYMLENDLIVDEWNVIKDVIEKPWKWQKEYFDMENKNE